MTSPSTVQNLLENWRKHFYLISSELSPRKLLERRYVDYVHKVLKEFYGDDFFHVNLVDAIEKNTLHFVHGALRKTTESSFYYLLELVILIERAKDVRKEHFEKLKSLRYRSSESREVLFEMYIDWLFELHDIPYLSNIQVGNQLKEGYCNIDEKLYLVECKQKYSLAITQLRLRQYMCSTLLQIAQQTKFGFEGIGIIRLKEDSLRQQDVIGILKRFKNYVVNRTEYYPSWKYDDDFIAFALEPMNTATMLALNGGIEPYDVYFTVVNKHKINDDGKNEFRISVNFRVTTARKQIAEKMISTIKKARTQHANEVHPMILFINNEFVEDFTAPLLSTNPIYVQKLEEYVNESSSDHIIVLVHRNFIGKRPKIKCQVVCKPQFNALKNEILKLNFSPIKLENLLDEV